VKDAFTLVELLLVITIIGVLTATVMVDFRDAKERREVSVLADQSLALLQQTHANIRSGKVEGEDYLCEGGYFELGKVPEVASMPYIDGECDFSQVSREGFGLYPGSAELGLASVGGVQLDVLWMLFEPPDGDISFYDWAGSDYIGDGKLEFTHPGDEALRIALSISHLTNQATLTVEHEK
jgi:prepilin-type N-terminal cleavage/methylation domain-containing protein